MSVATDLLALAKDALKEAGEAEAEICLTSKKRGFARFAVGELGQHMELEEPGAFVRAAHGMRVAGASTTRLDRPSLVEAIREAAAAARFVPETEGFTGFADGAEPLETAPRFEARTAAAGAEERVSRLAPAMGAVRAAGLVSAGALETSTHALAVATTRGCARSHESTIAAFKIWALETPGAGGAAGYGGHMHRDVSALRIAEETERAIRVAKLSRDPSTLDEGTYDVVLEPAALSELLEWLATIAFAAPEVENGTSPLADRLGERITGAGITLTEDPNDPSALGFAAPFDREGTARRRVPLIEDGIARGVLYDRIHAARARDGTSAQRAAWSTPVTSTGSALVPDSSLGVAIGPSALHMDAGDVANVDALLAGVDRGLYVCRLHYVNGLLEPRRAVMTGLTRDGCFLVEKGKISRPVGNLRFTDSLLEGLSRCDGRTVARSPVPTWWSDAGACVVPAIRMRGFRFNGRSQEKPKLA
ncbi:MAG: TldD/PmbA family protein [Polyangiaceae bacterium]